MTKVEKRISILGCGWLGFQLAQRLISQDITRAVKGSTTSPAKIAQLEGAGIHAYLFNLDPHFTAEPNTIESFMEADILVISIPPKLAKTGQDFHIDQIAEVIAAIKESPVKEIIYISSTSIYPELNRVVSEEDVTDPDQSPAPSMVKAENSLIALRPERSVSVLRLGGLLGYTRNPGKYVKGQKDMTTGSIPVNYIHRDDAAGAIAKIIETGIVDETFNIVAPLHPTRSEVYVKSCRDFGWEAPTFKTPEPAPDFKIISAQKLSDFYHYDFKYPDPLLFYYETEEQNGL
jgi:nucleoside-diphosphate-sugar epimerase